VWAGPIPADKIAALKDILKTADTINGKPWHLTEFEDSSSPRPGTEDLIFSAAADQSPVERPRNIVYAANIPGTVLPYLALTLGLCGFVVSRRRWSRTKEQ
jgi:hypothetical protein